MLWDNYLVVASHQLHLHGDTWTICLCSSLMSYKMKFTSQLHVCTLVKFNVFKLLVDWPLTRKPSVLIHNGGDSSEFHCSNWFFGPAGLLTGTVPGSWPVR